jgi:DNA-directed RNA polymerase specialized sigma24 family protein
MTVQGIDGASVPESVILYAWKWASCRAASLVRCGFYRWDDCEDLRQDLLVDFLQRFPKFNGSLGNPYAFAHALIQNHANKLAVRAAKRCQRTTVLFDYDDTGSRARFQEPRAEDSWGINRRIDVGGAINRLPPRLKRLALDLKSMNVPEVCEHRRISRSWVYQMLGEIRNSFIGHGLVAEGQKRRLGKIDSKVKKS